jgi:prolyl oligopeptidase
VIRLKITTVRPFPTPTAGWKNPDHPDTVAWVAAQNELTQNIMAELPVHQQFQERLTALWNYPKSSVPRHKAGRYFVQKNDGLQNQSILYQQDSLDASARAGD